MSQTQQVLTMFDDFSAFSGKLLLEVSESFLAVPEDAPSTGAPAEIPSGLAGLWTAVGAVLGVVHLRDILRKYKGLQALLKQTLALPETIGSDDEERLGLELGTALFRFASQLYDNQSEETLLHRYTSYIERIERNFRNFNQELAEDTISVEEHKREIEGLYLQSFYALTRLQRMT